MRKKDALWVLLGIVGLALVLWIGSGVERPSREYLFIDGGGEVEYVNVWNDSQTRVVGTLRHGDRVRVIEHEGRYVKVYGPSFSGWIPESLTSRTWLNK